MREPLLIMLCIVLVMYVVLVELRVIVCELESDSREHIEMSSAKVRELGLVGLGQTSVALVPKWKPLTRKQFDTVSTLWPTHFHEDKVYVCILTYRTLVLTTFMHQQT